MHSQNNWQLTKEHTYSDNFVTFGYFFVPAESTLQEPLKRILGGSKFPILTYLIYGNKKTELSLTRRLSVFADKTGLQLARVWD